MIYDRKTNQFRAPNGRFIRRESIRAEIEKAVDIVGRKTEAIAKDLNAGKINIAQFQIRMRDEIKRASLLSASVAKGGVRQMTASDFGKLGNDLKKQYAFLNKFARDIELGKVTSVKLEQRAKSYAQNIRAIYLNGEKEAFQSIGKTECMRVTHSLETCPECFAWEKKGFVPINEQPPIGGLICRVFCKCTLVYK